MRLEYSETMTGLGFKYLPVDSGERLKFLEQLLVEGQLYFPSVAAFNDPSEFRIHLRLPKQKAIIRRQYFIDNSRATEDEFESWYRNITPRSLRRFHEPLIRNDLSYQLGVLCLSQTCRDPIMWAHYAANHSGICVALNIGKIIDQISGLIFGLVSYRKRLPIVKYFGEDRKKVITKLILTKYKGWAYEKEFRIIAPQSNVTKQITLDVIDGIILGKDIPDDKEAQIRDILQSRPQPIKILKAHLSYTTYEMEISHDESCTDISEYK